VRACVCVCACASVCVHVRPQQRAGSMLWCSLRTECVSHLMGYLSRFFTDDPPVVEMDGSVHDSGSRPARACRGWVAGGELAIMSFASEDALLAMPVAPCARSKPPTWSNYRR
jgi:hypothetical protein